MNDFEDKVSSLLGQSKVPTDLLRAAKGKEQKEGEFGGATVGALITGATSARGLLEEPQVEVDPLSPI